MVECDRCVGFVGGGGEVFGNGAVEGGHCCDDVMLSVAECSSLRLELYVFARLESVERMSCCKLEVASWG